jgi:tetratricopeptide (TPR) repeat protein
MKVILRTLTIGLSIACFALTGAAISGAQTNPPATSDSINHVNKGAELVRQRQYDAAIVEFNAAIQADPNNANTYARRGYIYVTFLQDYAKGIADYEQALKLNPDDSDTQQRLQYARSVLKGAIETPGAMASKQSENVQSDTDHDNAGDKVNRGDVERALATVVGGMIAASDYNRASEQNLKDARAYVDRGKIKAKNGDKEGAMADYNRAIELDPRCASAYFNRAMIEVGNGAFDKFSADYDRAVELDPTLKPADNNPKTSFDSYDFGTKVGAWLANKALSHDEPKSQAAAGRHWKQCDYCHGSGRRPKGEFALGYENWAGGYEVDCDVCHGNGGYWVRD